MTATNAPTRARLRNNRLKVAIAGALAIACASTLLAQHAPDAAGGPPPTSRPYLRGMGGGMDGERSYGGGGRREGGWQNVPVPTAEEWEEVVSFMQENSPIRLQMYQKLEADKGADSMVTLGVRKRALARFRELKALGERKGDLYDFALKQFKIEDSVLATLAQIRRETETPALVERRTQQIRDFVQNALDERQARLDKLREFVAREEASLAHDRQDMSALEEKQRDRFDREMRRLIDFATDSSEPTTKPDAAP